LAHPVEGMGLDGAEFSMPCLISDGVYCVVDMIASQCW